MAKNKKIVEQSKEKNTSKNIKLRAKDRRLVKMFYKRAYKLYGSDYEKPTWTRSFIEKAYEDNNNEFLPDNIFTRINKDLHTIIENENSSIYVDLAKLVDKHDSDKNIKEFCTSIAGDFVGSLLLNQVSDRYPLSKLG